MNPNQRYNENLKIFHDAVQFKKPARVPFYSSDTFWRYYDAGYKLSEAVFDYRKMEDAAVKFACKYQFDSIGDIGMRNPLQVTTRLGNEEYIIDDINNTLAIKEQSCLEPEEYEAYIGDPTKVIWEKIMPRKYKRFNSDTTAEDMVDYLRELVKYALAMQRINKALKEKAGAVPFTDAAMVIPPIEMLVSFYRGFRGTGKDLRRIPDKVQGFVDSQWDPKSVETIKSIKNSKSCFNANIPMLSQNLMNRKQFEAYYWPHLKQIAYHAEKADSAVFLLAEGTTKHITEYLQELPKGHFCVYVESDDIFERRKALPNVCLCGGIPTTLLGQGTKQQCIDHVKRVIEEVGSDGGLILCVDKFTANPKDCNPENLRAIGEYLHEGL